MLELGLVLLSYQSPRACVTPRARDSADPAPVYDTVCLSEWVRAVAEGRVRAGLTPKNRESLKDLYRNLNGIL